MLSNGLRSSSVDSGKDSVLTTKSSFAAFRNTHLMEVDFVAPICIFVYLSIVAHGASRHTSRS